MTTLPLIDARLVPEAVFDAFPPEVRGREMAYWASLTPENRALAGPRLQAVREWENGATGRSAQDIADTLGVSRSRFYRMLSDWRRAPSMTALGVQAPKDGGRGVGPSRTAAHDAMQRHLPKVVAADAEGRVSVLARRLKAVIALGGLEPPGDTVLRAAVAREKHRLALGRMAGSELLCDFVAVGIPAKGDIPHVMFTCIDGATGYIFGISVGTSSATRRGYAKAAADALLRLDRQSPALPWAPSLLRAQVTIGPDAAAWTGFFEKDVFGIAANVQPKGAGKRYGADIKRMLGDSLGRIRLLARQTGELRPLRISVTSETFDDNEAKARIEAEVYHHNAKVLNLAGPGMGEPPLDLRRLLERLAGYSDSV